jgi:hypothetical protein
VAVLDAAASVTSRFPRYAVVPPVAAMWSGKGSSRSSPRRSTESMPTTWTTTSRPGLGRTGFTRPAGRPGQRRSLTIVCALPEPPDAPAAKPAARWPWIALGAVVVAIAAAVGALLAESAPPARSAAPAGLSAPAGSAAPSGIVYVTVQNKVASGADGFYEDVTPEYLANAPVPRCAEKSGCEIPNTDMGSEVVLEAICQEPGASITNEDTGSAGIAQNPNGVTSARWYRVVMPNGVQGLISEAYLTPASRGGLGLPRCSS